MSVRVSGSAPSYEIISPVNLVADVPLIVTASVIQRIGDCTIETAAGEIIDGAWSRINDTQIYLQASSALTNLTVTLRS